MSDQQDVRRKNYELRRSIADYGWGTFIFCFGAFLLISHRFGIYFSIEPFFLYCLSALFMIYGAWRLYRGYKKNYYKD